MTTLDFPLIDFIESSFTFPDYEFIVNSDQFSVYPGKYTSLESAP